MYFQSSAWFHTTGLLTFPRRLPSSTVSRAQKVFLEHSAFSLVFLTPSSFMAQQEFPVVACDVPVNHIHYSEHPCMQHDHILARDAITVDPRPFARKHTFLTDSLSLSHGITHPGHEHELPTRTDTNGTDHVSPLHPRGHFSKRS